MDYNATEEGEQYENINESIPFANTVSDVWDTRNTSTENIHTLNTDTVQPSCATYTNEPSWR